MLLYLYLRSYLFKKESLRKIPIEKRYCEIKRIGREKKLEKNGCSERPSAD